MDVLDKPSVEDINLKKVITYDGFIFYVDNNFNIYNKNMRLLTQRIGRDGYYIIAARKQGGSETSKFVHRIIAQAFIKNDLDDKYEVHHKDRNRANNSINNLEVLLRYDHKLEHNLKYSEQKQCIVCGKLFTPNITKRLRAKVCSKECKSVIDKETGIKKRKPINQLDLNNNLIKSWDYGMLIEEETGWHLSNINKCLKGKINSAYGYKWEYGAIR